MLFNSPEFLFVFLPLVGAAFFVLRRIGLSVHHQLRAQDRLSGRCAPLRHVANPAKGVFSQAGCGVDAVSKKAADRC